MHTLTQLPGTTRRRYQDGDVNTAPHITIAQRSRLRRELRVRKATAETQDGTQIDDDPKSEAGKRPIALPGGLRTDIEIHLTRYARNPALTIGCSPGRRWHPSSAQLQPPLAASAERRGHPGRDGPPPPRPAAPEDGPPAGRARQRGPRRPPHHKPPRTPHTPPPPPPPPPTRRPRRPPPPPAPPRAAPPQPRTRPRCRPPMHRPKPPTTPPPA